MLKRWDAKANEVLFGPKGGPWTLLALVTAIIVLATLTGELAAWRLGVLAGVMYVFPLIAFVLRKRLRWYSDSPKHDFWSGISNDERKG